MQEVEEQLGYTSNTPVYHNNKFHDVVAIDKDEILLLMLKEMYSQEGIHCDACTDAAELMEMIRQKEYSLLLTDLNMPCLLYTSAFDGEYNTTFVFPEKKCKSSYPKKRK